MRRIRRKGAARRAAGSIHGAEQGEESAGEPGEPAENPAGEAQDPGAALEREWEQLQCSAGQQQGRAIRKEPPGELPALGFEWPQDGDGEGAGDREDDGPVGMGAAPVVPIAGGLVQDNPQGERAEGRGQPEEGVKMSLLKARGGGVHDGDVGNGGTTARNRHLAWAFCF